MPHVRITTAFLPGCHCLQTTYKLERPLGHPRQRPPISTPATGVGRWRLAVIKNMPNIIEADHAVGILILHVWKILACGAPLLWGGSRWTMHIRGLSLMSFSCNILRLWARFLRGSTTCFKNLVCGGARPVMVVVIGSFRKHKTDKKAVTKNHCVLRVTYNTR